MKLAASLHRPATPVPVEVLRRNNGRILARISHQVTDEGGGAAIAGKR
jgi:hypothetical protein